MLKYGAFLGAVAVLAVACGSSGDDEETGGKSSGGKAGTGGTIGIGGSLGGSSGSSGSSGSGSVDDLRNSACAGWSAEPEALPAVLMLVVDVSGSMDSPAPGNTETKWAVTRDALSEALDALPPSTAVGIIYYPNLGIGVESAPSTIPRPITACVNTGAMIAIDALGASGSAHRTALSQSLANAVTGNGTPTHDAYKYAVENGMVPSMFPGNRYMLLITDGQPTFLLECIGTGYVSNPVDEQPIIDEIAAARTQDIRTFVIGSPGSEANVSTGADARPWLSQAATAGGTAVAGCSGSGPNYCHMDMTQAPDFAAALKDALAKVAGVLVSCEYDLPAPPPGEQLDLGKINVINTPSGGDPTILPRNDDASCTDGWYLDAATQRVRLCSNTCAVVESDPGVSLEVLFGCESQTEPPR